jgi:hypothetical protein
VWLCTLHLSLLSVQSVEHFLENDALNLSHSQSIENVLTKLREHHAKQTGNLGKLMRKPNELARQVMNRAADYNAEIADLYDMMADNARRFAIALREGDSEGLFLDNKDSLHGKVEEAKRNAVDQLKMLLTADKEWWTEFARESARRRISGMSREELVIEILAHAVECKNPHHCAIHQLLEERVKKIAG